MASSISAASLVFAGGHRSRFGVVRRAITALPRNVEAPPGGDISTCRCSASARLTASRAMVLALSWNKSPAGDSRVGRADGCTAPPGFLTGRPTADLDLDPTPSEDRLRH